MLAVRAKYDGREIHVPECARPSAPCNVIVLFEEQEASTGVQWLKLQEQTLAKAWDDKEDGIYDQA